VALTAVAAVVAGNGAAGGPAKAVVAAGSAAELPAAEPLPAAVHAPRRPALHCRPTAAACVDLRRRLAWLQAGGRVSYGPVPTGTAMPGHRTPRGLFRVAWKAPQWVSTEYGIPMPWSVFFATGGIAFHAGPLGEPSHGCVHLAPAAARHFFDALAVGDRVDVH
jgi:hypothetical protein